MFGTGFVGSDKWQVNASGVRSRQFNFRLFCCFPDALQGHLINGQVNAFRFPKSIDDPAHDDVVEVISPEVVVAGGGFNFKNAIP